MDLRFVQFQISSFDQLFERIQLVVNKTHRQAVDKQHPKHQHRGLYPQPHANRKHAVTNEREES